MEFNDMLREAVISGLDVTFKPEYIQTAQGGVVYSIYCNVKTITQYRGESVAGKPREGRGMSVKPEEALLHALLSMKEVD